MQVVWEVDTAEFARRRRAARACLTCAKNKKRCIHTFIRSRHPDAHISPSGQTTAGHRRRAERHQERGVKHKILKRISASLSSPRSHSLLWMTRHPMGYPFRGPLVLNMLLTLAWAMNICQNPKGAILCLWGLFELSPNVLRDARKERKIVQKEASARCQTLENLSTCWQNANVVAKLGRVALRSLQQTSTGLRNFTNLLTGIDADIVDAPRIADTEAGQKDTLYGRAGATRSGKLTPGTQIEVNLNSTDTISVDGMEQTVGYSEQISDSVQDFNPEETTYYSPQTYLSQTTRQYVPPDFPSTAVPSEHDYPSMFGSTENVQGFNQLSFFEGFFDLGMPTS